MPPDGRVPTLLARASRVLDVLQARANAGEDLVLSRTAQQLRWAAQWLDPHLAGRVGEVGVGLDAPSDAISTLRQLADAFEQLVETFEDEDPIQLASGVQVGSLAFAILGAAAARLERQAPRQGG